MAEVAAIILAAGTASRFRAGRPGAKTKLVQDFQGQPMVRHAAVAALHSRAKPVIVVTGFDQASVCQALHGLALRVVQNEAFESGLASSLQAGIAALGSESQAAIILLGDMPQVSARLINRLIECFIAAPDAAAVVPLFRGRRGNPVVLARSLFAAIGGLAGDQGANRLLVNPALPITEVPLDDPASITDIDTLDTLTSLSGTPPPAEA